MIAQKALSKIYFEIENETAVFIIVNSSPEEIEYSEEWLEHQLIEYGYSGLQVLSTAHEKIAELLSNNQSGRVMLGQKKDAKVDVKVSNDLLSAKLCITAPEGGVSPGAKIIVDALNSKEISLNLVDIQKIVDLVLHSKVIEPGEIVDVVVATGRAPQHGIDTQFKCLVDQITDRKPNLRDDGSLDYYNLGEIPSVEAGCNLMRMVAPVPAKNGRSVSGHDLKARVGKKLKFNNCKGADISPDDPDLLVSTKKGQPVIINGGVKIENVYTVDNVDVHTGHIDFDGSLVVKGDVVSGMKIDVTGDVQVFGLVENASINAGGNIDLKLGAIGRADKLETEEKMQLNCEGNLSAAQLESVFAHVQGDIFVKSRISNCEINAGHQVIVGNSQQDKSGIVGGNVTAGSVIRAEVLGSSVGTSTTVAIACSDATLESFNSVKQDILENEVLLERMIGLAVGLTKKRSAEAKKLLTKTKEQTREIKAKINVLNNKKYEIEAHIAQANEGKIIVKKEAYHGVTVKIMRKEQLIKARYSQGVFSLLRSALAFNSVMT